MIEKAIRGNKKAQGLIYRRYHKRILNYILSRVQSLEDAEEILQETFISAFEALPFYSGRSSWLTWICGIAKHEIADFYRKKKIKTVVFSLFPSLEIFVSKALGPEADLEEKELKRKVLKVLRLLAEGYARILRLKYMQGFSVREIAQKFGETEKAIESRLTRARKAFARIYVNIDRGG
ncbi:MAG TPA: RNA polymerase sigma factor [Candidatus Bathyarchaeia archaeon]|nr:RNA polymerase sigma factor [Candidatus Bathyarchaeia archaeon]